MKDKLVMAAIILLVVGLFFGILGGSLYVAHDATNSVCKALKLPPFENK